MSTIHKKLCKIQAELKAPKNQTNTFGNYSYRSCEDIVEAVKPLLHAEGLVLLMYDEIINVGTKNYVQATAAIMDAEDLVKCKASAREAESRKGMDDSQLTGATSSYARKYALNGLFAIDDMKDADTMQPEKEEKKTSSKPKKEEGEEWRNWIEEIKLCDNMGELKSIFGLAYKATEGKEKADVKMAYDKKKTQFERKEK